MLHTQARNYGAKGLARIQNAATSSAIATIKGSKSSPSFSLAKSLHGCSWLMNKALLYPSEILQANTGIPATMQNAIPSLNVLKAVKGFGTVIRMSLIGEGSEPNRAEAFAVARRALMFLLNTIDLEPIQPGRQPISADYASDGVIMRVKIQVQAEAAK